MYETSSHVETNISESSIRFVEDIWREEINNSHDEVDKRLNMANREQPLVIENNRFEYEQLIKIIGDLDALQMNSDLAEKYARKLDSVNNFMDGFDYFV